MERNQAPHSHSDKPSGVEAAAPAQPRPSPASTRGEGGPSCTAPVEQAHLRGALSSWRLLRPGKGYLLQERGWVPCTMFTFQVPREQRGHLSYQRCCWGGCRGHPGGTRPPQQGQMKGRSQRRAPGWGGGLVMLNSQQRPPRMGVFLRHALFSPLNPAFRAAPSTPAFFLPKPIGIA